MSIKTKQNSLGEAIKKARKEMGLSQREFADYLQISDKAVSSYEVGRATPNFDMLRKIGRVVHKPITYFDDDYDEDDIDLQIKLKTIERELLEIKKILRKKNRS